MLGCFEHPQVEHYPSFFLDEGNISVTIPCLLKGLFEFAFPNQLQCPDLETSAGWEVGVEGQNQQVTGLLSALLLVFGQLKPAPLGFLSLEDFIP